MSSRRSDGSPYIQAATSPSLDRGSPITKTGSPEAMADCRPAGSVSTAIAPAAAAASQNRAPCTVAPGRAAYRSPGRTARESWVMPVRPGGRPGPAATSTSGSAGRRPSSTARPASGRGCRRSGRKAAGTGRGYLRSRCREPDIRRSGVVGCDLHGLQRELHDVEERRSGDLVTVVLAPRVLNIEGHDQLRVVSRRDADVAVTMLAEALAQAGVRDLRGPGLSRHRVAVDLSP